MKSNFLNFAIPSIIFSSVTFLSGCASSMASQEAYNESSPIEFTNIMKKDLSSGLDKAIVTLDRQDMGSIDFATTDFVPFSSGVAGVLASYKKYCESKPDMKYIGSKGQAPILTGNSYITGWGIQDVTVWSTGCVNKEENKPPIFSVFMYQYDHDNGTGFSRIYLLVTKPKTGVDSKSYYADLLPIVDMFGKQSSHQIHKNAINSIFK